MGKYRVILADDHAVVRAGVKKLIDSESKYTVVGEASDGEELLEKIKSTPCELLLLDLSMPKVSGLKVLEEISSKYPDIKVLVLTMHSSKEFFKAAMQRGASGYIVKDDAFEQVLAALKAVMEGKKFISPSITESIVDNYVRPIDEVYTLPLEIFTESEIDVIRLIAQEHTNKDIADKLGSSVRTIEAHRAKILSKLSVKTTAGIVRYAIYRKLV